MQARAALAIGVILIGIAACGDGAASGPDLEDEVEGARDVVADATGDADGAGPELVEPDTGPEAGEVAGEDPGDVGGEGETEVDDPAEVEVGDSGGDADTGHERSARGRLTRDDRRVDALAGRLGPVEIAPVGDVIVTVRAGGVTLGTARTDADGRFSVALSAGAGGDGGADDRALELLVVAADAAEDAGDAAPGLVIFDGDGVAVPGRPGVPVPVVQPWAWVATPPPDAADAGDFGEVHIDEAAGAGALALLAQVRALRRAVGATFGRDRLTSLAVLWSPLRTPSCLSCYLPMGWGPVVWSAPDGEVRFDRAVFFSGTAETPHHYTPSIVAHELGHWVLDTVSRHPEVGGSHGWDQVVPAPLAWSEGFSTFFAQWSLSSPGAPAPRFFAVQSGVEYWIDLDAIGRTAMEGDSSIDVTFPMPLPGGGLSQPLNEAVVAAMLWDLWDGAGAAGADDDEPVMLGDPMLPVLASDRMRTMDRGVSEPDLVDYLDALACEGVSTGVELAPALMGFPWDGAPLCP